MRRIAIACTWLGLVVSAAVAADIEVLDRAATVISEPGLTTTRLEIEATDTVSAPLRTEISIPIDSRAVLSDVIVTTDGADLVAETVPADVAARVLRAERAAGRPLAWVERDSPAVLTLGIDAAGGAAIATIDLTTIRATTVEQGVVRSHLPHFGTDPSEPWTVAWTLRSEYPLALPDESDVAELEFETDGPWLTLRAQVDPDEIDESDGGLDLDHVLAPGAPARVELITHRTDDGPGTYHVRVVFPELTADPEPIRNVRIVFEGVPVRGGAPSRIETLPHGASFTQTGRYVEPGETRLTIFATVDGEPCSWFTTVVFPRYEDRWPEIERLWAGTFSIGDRTILLPAERFEVHGIGTATRDRARLEADARMARRELPPRSIRADDVQPAFGGRDAPGIDIGAGAVDTTMLWLIAGGFVLLRLTRRWEARR